MFVSAFPASRSYGYIFSLDLCNGIFVLCSGDSCRSGPGFISVRQRHVLWFAVES